MEVLLIVCPAAAEAFSPSLLLTNKPAEDGELGVGAHCSMDVGRRGGLLVPLGGQAVSGEEGDRPSAPTCDPPRSGLTMRCCSTSIGDLPR